MAVRSPSGARLTAVSAPAAPVAGVLVLHGGAADARRPVRPWHLGHLRMVPFARALARLLPDVTVMRLRHSVAGWNGSGTGVLDEARWALQSMEAVLGVPVVLVGHSLGGRVAARLSPVAAGAVLLAPWLPAEDPIGWGRRGNGLRVVQTPGDRTCPPADTTTWLHRAAEAGSDVRIRMVPGSDHGMVRHFSTWHTLAAAGVRHLLRPT